MKRLVLTVSMVAALAACSRGGGSPAAVTEEFMRKMESGNCSGIGDYLSKSSQAVAPKLEAACTQGAEMKKSAPKDKTLSSVNVLESTENGDRATVRLEAVMSDGSKQGGSDAITLVREDGRWKIDLLATGMSQGGGSGGMGPAPAPPVTTPPVAPTPMPTAPTTTPPPATTDTPTETDAETPAADPDAPKPE